MSWFAGWINQDPGRTIAYTIKTTGVKQVDPEGGYPVGVYGIMTERDVVVLDVWSGDGGIRITDMVRRISHPGGAPTYKVWVRTGGYTMQFCFHGQPVGPKAPSPW